MNPSRFLSPKVSKQFAIWILLGKLLSISPAWGDSPACTSDRECQVDQMCIRGSCHWSNGDAVSCPPGGRIEAPLFPTPCSGDPFMKCGVRITAAEDASEARLNATLIYIRAEKVCEAFGCKPSTVDYTTVPDHAYPPTNSGTLTYFPATQLEDGTRLPPRWFSTGHSDRKLLFDSVSCF